MVGTDNYIYLTLKKRIMKWYRLQKVRNRNRTYFLSERELAEAMVRFIQGNVAYQWMEPRRLVETFFNDEHGLEAIMDYKTELKMIDYLLDIVAIYRRNVATGKGAEY
jgi:hypothetical protein